MTGNSARRKVLKAMAGAALAPVLGAPLAARAQEYPARPIRLVVPFPPGQGSDLAARLLADEVSRGLGQPIVVENRAGAGGAISAGYVARQPADGYTLLMATSSTHSIAPALIRNVGYDPIKDFAPVANFVYVDQVLVTAPSKGFADARDFIAAAKTKPINYASSGSGSTSHLSMELLREQADLPLLTHIPFKGSAEASTQLLGGQVDAMFDSLPALLAQIKGGRIKALGIGSRNRSSLLPDLPTLREQGLSNFEVQGWGGILAPAGTPAPILDKLNETIRRVIEAPEFRKKLLATSLEPAPMTRDEFTAFIKNELAKWGAVIKRSGAKAD